MGRFGMVDAAKAVPAERRAHERSSVNCTASLTTVTGRREGRLVDLSAMGARFDVENLPAEGASGMLRWKNHEFYCSVIWAKDGACGITFEQALPKWVLDETVTVETVTSGPVANFGNIPLAQKRSRRAGLVARG